MYHIHPLSSLHAGPMCYTSFYIVCSSYHRLYSPGHSPPCVLLILFCTHLYASLTWRSFVFYSPLILSPFRFPLCVLFSQTTIYSLHESPCVLLHPPCYHLCIPSMYFPSSPLHTLYFIPNASCVTSSSYFSSLLLYLHITIHTYVYASCTTSHIFFPSSSFQMTHFILGNLISTAQPLLTKFLHILSILFTL